MSEEKRSRREEIEAAYDAVVEQEVEQNEAEIVETPDKVQEKIPESSKIPETSAEDSSDDKPESLDAPSHWSPEDISEFNELDEKGRRLYLKRDKQREAAFTKKSQSLSEERRIAEKYRQVTDPYKEQFKKLNIDEFDAFQRGATAHLRLVNSTPQERGRIFQQLAQEYGVNLSPQQAQQYAQQAEVDPNIHPLLQKISHLEQRQQFIEQERVRQEYSSLESHIISFQNAVNDKGEPKYPHYETLRLDMSEILQKGMAKSLEEAYNKAFRLNDDLHQEHINRQYNDRIRNEDTAKKTVASKRAGFNVKGSGSGSTPEASETLSRRQTIEKAYDAQTKRQRI